MRGSARGCLTQFVLNDRTGKFASVRNQALGRETLRLLRFAERGWPWSSHLAAIGLLLHALFLGVPPDQGIEDGEDVAPVFDHAVENISQFRVALGVAVPLQQYRGRHFDIAAELLGRMAPQEQAIEKRRFPLGKGEVCGDFHRNDLCDRGHKEKCSLPKSASASSGTVALLSLGG
jgi:hypothetical protein